MSTREWRSARCGPASRSRVRPASYQRDGIRHPSGRAPVVGSPVLCSTGVGPRHSLPGQSWGLQRRGDPRPRRDGHRLPCAPRRSRPPSGAQRLGRPCSSVSAAGRLPAAVESCDPADRAAREDAGRPRGWGDPPLDGAIRARGVRARLVPRPRREHRLRRSCALRTNSCRTAEFTSSRPTSQLNAATLVGVIAMPEDARGTRRQHLPQARHRRSSRRTTVASSQSSTFLRAGGAPLIPSRTAIVSKTVGGPLGLSWVRIPPPPLLAGAPAVPWPRDGVADSGAPVDDPRRGDARVGVPRHGSRLADERVERVGVPPHAG